MMIHFRGSRITITDLFIMNTLRIKGLLEYDIITLIY